jgi:protein CpxP
MCKLLSLIVFAVALNVSAYAQSNKIKDGTATEQIDRLRKRIAGITNEQAVKIKILYATENKTIDSLLTGENGDLDPLGGKLRPLRKATSAKIKAVLTKEQATAYQKWLDELDTKFETDDN